jgi:hypothetical protein
MKAMESAMPALGVKRRRGSEGGEQVDRVSRGPAGSAVKRSASDDALRFARSCYDHLAGHIGVAVTDALVSMGHIVLTDQGGEVTSSGERFLSAFGVDLRLRTRRIFCQPCLDWSERRYHLKGLVGARILDRLLEFGWLKCVSGSRALKLTSSGRAGVSETFQIEINNEGVPTARLCDPRRLTA